MATHTKTPWKIESEDSQFSDKDDVYIIGNPTGENGGHRKLAIMLPTYADSEANAAHIVKCVNERDELLAALKKFHEAGCGNSTDFRIQGEAFDLYNKVMAKAQS